MTEATQATRRHDVSLVAGIMLVTVLLYARALGGGFLYFDDPENVLDNYSIRAISAENLAHFFSAPLQYMYTPIVSISYAVDYAIGGPHPWIYHLTNVTLHLCNIVLVYLVCQRLTRRDFVVRFVTIAFAIHPMNVDTVSWISTRSTLLATCFSLASVLAYLHYRRTRTIAHLLASVALFGLATLSKSTAVALPLAIVLLDYYRGRKLDRRLVLEKLPFFAIALAIGIVGLNFRVDTSALHHYTLVDRVVLVCSALTAYLGRVVVPFPLSFAYAYPAKHGDLLPWYLYLTPVVLCVVVFALWKTRISKKTIVFGLGFFLVNIVLSQTVLLVDNYQSNRYAYLPYLGLFLVLGHLARRVYESRTGWLARGRPVWQGVLVVFAVGFAVLTFVRGGLWTHPVAVLDDAIAHQPKVPFVYTIRGLTEYRQGENAAALKDFDRAIALDPRSTLSYYYKGVIRATTGDAGGAVPDLDKAISLSSRFAPGYGERGKAKLALKDYGGAVNDLSQAIAWDGYYLDAYLSRGITYTELNNYQLAIADFDRAVELNPDFAETYGRRGTARHRIGDTAGACADWGTARSLGYQQSAQDLATYCTGS